MWALFLLLSRPRLFPQDDGASNAEEVFDSMDFFSDYFYRDHHARSPDSSDILQVEAPGHVIFYMKCAFFFEREVWKIMPVLTWSLLGRVGPSNQTSPKDTPNLPNQKVIMQFGLQFVSSTFDWNMVKGHGLLYKCLNTSKSQPTCGRILEHAKEQVMNMLCKIGITLCVFKIGITANPLVRYASYVEMGYTTMWLINESSSLELTSMLEAALISSFQDRKGCKNKANSGGEGSFNKAKPPKPPYFTYVVGGRADQPRWVG